MIMCETVRRIREHQNPILHRFLNELYTSTHKGANVPTCWDVSLSFRDVRHENGLSENSAVQALDPSCLGLNLSSPTY